MTTTPPAHSRPPGPAGPRQAPVGPEPDPRDADVLFLAGQRPAADGEWLLITEVDGLPGALFTAWHLAEDSRHGHGGDVLIRLAPAGGGGLAPAAIDVSLWAILSGRLIPVAAWDGHDLDGWPERIRPAAAFAMGILAELEEHDGADLRAGDRVDLDAAAAVAVPGIPPRLTFGRPGRR